MKKSIFILSVALAFLASCSSEDNNTPNTGVKPVEGSIQQPNVGGPNEPNQVYVDLSSGTSVAVERTAWDLGFYSGSDFRVVLNGSLKMAVKKLNTTNIDEVQQPDNNVSVNFSVEASLGYADNPNGILTGAGGGEGTAIAEISANDANNAVYLVNMGFGLSTIIPGSGSANVDGAARGWKKIRILRSGNDYKLQYADIDATTHTEVIISKRPDYNFTFFSMVNKTEVNVEPIKTGWDLNFTTFTNYYPYNDTFVLYPFADYTLLNVKGGTRAYEIKSEDANGGETAYNAFTAAGIDDSKFAASALDHRFVAWRTEAGPNTTMGVRTDRFFVIKDAEGNYYKVLFRALKNDAGERGYPIFEYKLLK
ncbi:HmuY family protein [Flavobacterium hauense]